MHLAKDAEVGEGIAEREMKEIEDAETKRSSRIDRHGSRQRDKRNIGAVTPVRAVGHSGMRQQRGLLLPRDELCLEGLTPRGTFALVCVQRFEEDGVVREIQIRRANPTV